MAKKNLAVKLDDETDARLTACAERTKTKKHQLMLAAIEAAIEAIEQNDYRIVFPVKFDVRDVPVALRDAPPQRKQA